MADTMDTTTTDYDGAAAEHGEEPAHPQQQQQHQQRQHPPPPGSRRPLALTLPIIQYLNAKRVVLASASPRRRALLAQIGLNNLDIIPSTMPEDLDKSAYGPEEYVAETARRKCLDVYKSLIYASAAAGERDVGHDPDVVIAADTIIATRAGRILEKPRSEQDHINMLKHLRDTVRHRVLTAVCVMAPRADAREPGYAMATTLEETTVVFAQAEPDPDGDGEGQGGVGDDVIEAYVKTREGADKAGGYAVQGVGGLLLVDRIEGSLDNVIGLPVRKTLALAERVVFRQEEETSEDEE